MRIILGSLLLLCLHAHAFDTSYLVSDHYNFDDETPNTIHGMITFTDFSQCTRPRMNRRILTRVLDRAFGEAVTGVSCVEHTDDSDTENCYEFSLSQSGEEGISTEWVENDYYNTIEKIKSAIIGCPAEIIEVHGLESLHSELLVGRVPEEARKFLTDLFEIYERRHLSVTIPTSKSYRTDIGPSRNQGSIGSCASFSTDALFQYYEKRDNGISQEFSPKFFYYHRCVNDYTTGYTAPCGSGMVMEWIGELVQMVGNVPEEEYPYENVSENENDEVISETLKELGRTKIEDYMTNEKNDEWNCFEPDTFGEFDDFVLSMKSHLAMYGPMMIGTNVYNHRQCDIWNSHNKGMLGGHAMVVIGYDDEGLDIRNSWGETWCGDGHHKMLWEDAYDRSMSYCIWEKPTEAGVELCYDTEEWSDFMGSTCADYRDNLWCQDCQNGPSWGSSRRGGDFKDWTTNNCDSACGCCEGVSYQDVIVSDDVSDDVIISDKDDDDIIDDVIDDIDDDVIDDIIIDVSTDVTDLPEVSTDIIIDVVTDVPTEFVYTSSFPTQSPVFSPTEEEEKTCDPDIAPKMICKKFKGRCSWSSKMQTYCATTCCKESSMPAWINSEISVAGPNSLTRLEEEGQMLAQIDAKMEVNYGAYAALFALGACSAFGVMYLWRRKHGDNTYMALLENEI